MLCQIEEVLELLIVSICENNLTVLLVEDSSFHQLLLSLYLRQIGHTVVVACDGLEALTEIQQMKKYDLLLLDCQQSLVDGSELTRLVRKQEKIDGVGTTIIGFGNLELAEKSCDAGMDDFLDKPSKKQLLKAVLRHWLRPKAVLNKETI